MRRKCSKCGSGAVMLDYREQTDELACKCAACNYGWTEKPHDKQPDVAAMLTDRGPRRPFPWVPLVVSAVVILALVFYMVGTHGGHS